MPNEASPKLAQTQKKANNHHLNLLPQEATRSGEVNEKHIAHAIQRHGDSLVPALNRKERKLVRKHLIDELGQGFDHRREALGMALETRLHSIREACNHVLVTGKTHLRQQRLEYFGQVFSQVEERMNGFADQFLQDMDKRFDNLKNYNNPRIKAREQQRLEKQVDDFLDTLDQLMDEFRSIIGENISHNQQGEPTASTHDDIGHNFYDPLNSSLNNNMNTGTNNRTDEFMEAAGYETQTRHNSL